MFFADGVSYLGVNLGGGGVYDHVRDDLNRKAESHEGLPDLVTNAYLLLGTDWLETQRSWNKLGSPTPPVMIAVANRTETAARIKYSFDNKKVLIDELCKPGVDAAYRLESARHGGGNGRRPEQRATATCGGGRR